MEHAGRLGSPSPLLGRAGDTYLDSIVEFKAFEHLFKNIVTSKKRTLSQASKLFFDGLPPALVNSPPMKTVSVLT